MKTISRIPFAVIGLAFFGVAPATSATLVGQTINADITISGQDDNGFYSITVLNAPVTIPGPGFATTIPVFKQLTEGGFSTASNQINGSVSVNISANAISVTMNGQVQPFELESQFTGIGGTITNVVDTATGLMAGVNLDFSHTFTASSVDFATVYLGFQPGTLVTQTETLTFAAASGVPEPATWAMTLLGFAGLGFAANRRSMKSVGALAAA